VEHLVGGDQRRGVAERGRLREGLGGLAQGGEAALPVPRPADGALTASRTARVSSASRTRISSMTPGLVTCISRIPL
jgi:hypothetical protein